MDFRLFRCLEENMDMDVYVSELQHMHRELGDLNFCQEIATYDLIGVMWQRKCFAKALYALAFLDYLSDKHNIPRCKEYESLRKNRLENPYYSSSISAKASLGLIDIDSISKECEKDTIGKYFAKYNILERGLLDVI